MSVVNKRNVSSLDMMCLVFCFYFTVLHFVKCLSEKKQFKPQKKTMSATLLSKVSYTDINVAITSHAMQQKWVITWPCITSLSVLNWERTFHLWLWLANVPELHYKCDDRQLYHPEYFPRGATVRTSCSSINSVAVFARIPVLLKYAAFIITLFMPAVTWVICCLVVSIRALTWLASLTS